MAIKVRFEGKAIVYDDANYVVQRNGVTELWTARWTDPSDKRGARWVADVPTNLAIVENTT